MPVVARAQQPARPVVGLLHATSFTYFEPLSASVRRGLGESGLTEGRNVTIEYRWAEGQNGRLPALAADLVGRSVDVLFAVGGTAPALAAKAATSTIPIVFVAAADPIKAGLVASLSRPGGNVTGVSMLGSELEAKRLEILHQLAPKAALIGVLVNPTYPDAERQRRELQDAADKLHQRIAVVTAGTEGAIETAFAEWLLRTSSSLRADNRSWRSRHATQCPRSLASASTPRLVA